MKKNLPDDVLRLRGGALPDSPGVYLFLDADKTVIYTGKANSLKKRVASYFRVPHPDPKTAAMVKRARDIEYIVTDNEMEALLLENSLIKKHKPRFNVRLKDDKQYPYIAVTLHERYPRLIYTRKTRIPGARYFGPYTDARAARATAEMANRLFRLRTCSRDLPLRENERPCLNHQIGRCLGPCKEYISHEDYQALVSAALTFLEGHVDPVVEDLRRLMLAHSEKLEYEKAAAIKQILADITALNEDQKVASAVGDDRDFITTLSDKGETLVLLFEFRGGLLLGRKVSVMENSEDQPAKEAVRSFLVDYYTRNDIPGKIVTTAAIRDRKIIESLFIEKSGRRVIITAPVGADDDRIVNLMGKNLAILMAERRAAASKASPREALVQLRDILGLENEIETMVCFDISNIQGTANVASMVTFYQGEPEKSEYRRFKIRGYEGANDPGMIHEAVARRLQHLLNEKLSLPDLMVIDGGPTQLTRAREAARALDAPLAIISLAKRDEEIFTDPKKPPILLPKNSPALKLLQRIRDEAHRFAVTYHRSLRDRAMLRSRLDEIPGVGAEAKKNLLASFGTADGVAGAAIEELAAVKGIGKKTASKIYDFFHPES